jgi:ssDNA thymidine ADP-ribosyltransferase, DarT
MLQLSQRSLILLPAKNALSRYTAIATMNISEIVETRKIESIVHFTTNRGSLGVLATKKLKARARLSEDALLKHIFQVNAADRSRDAAWHDYVNLSISKINAKFFEVSAGAWHKETDFWWCILAFDPVILGHAGVKFATTNNMYSGVLRNAGENGLDALFDPSIRRWHSSTVTRSATLDQCLPTCPQAEVLYPGEISTDFLQAIYVQTDASADELAGQFAAVAHRSVKIEVRPELFQNIK